MTILTEGGGASVDFRGEGPVIGGFEAWQGLAANSANRLVKVAMAMTVNTKNAPTNWVGIGPESEFRAILLSKIEHALFVV